MKRYDLDDFCQRSDIKTEELDSILEALPNVGTADEGPWIAGGLLRRVITQKSIEEGDVDYFFKSKEQYNAFVSEILELGGKQLHKNEHVTTFDVTVTSSEETESLFEIKSSNTYIVQAITMDFYNDVEDLLDTFDFTLCQFALTDEHLCVGDYTLWDVGRKRMAVHKITYGVSTIRRILKYKDQGYTICGGGLATILQAIADNPELIQADTEYVD